VKTLIQTMTPGHVHVSRWTVLPGVTGRSVHPVSFAPAAWMMPWLHVHLPGKHCSISAFVADGALR
jgi:hypothetical protein